MDLKEQDIQNKLDEMTAYETVLLKVCHVCQKMWRFFVMPNARLAQENHEILEQLFQTAVGLLSTYGKFAYMHPEELLMYLKNELKK